MKREFLTYPFSPTQEFHKNLSYNEIIDIMKESWKKSYVSEWFDVAPLNSTSKNYRKESRSQYTSNSESISEDYCKVIVSNCLSTEEMKAILKKLAEEMQTNDISKVLEQNIEKQKLNSKLTLISVSPKSILPEAKEDFLAEKDADIILERCLKSEEARKNFQLRDVSNASRNELPKQTPNKSGKGAKRTRGKQSEDAAEGSSKRSKATKKDNESGDKAKNSSKKEKIPDVSALDFSNDSKSSSGASWNFKISSWNINGIRAWLEKNGISYLHHELPDIMCVQETKCSDDKLPEEVKEIEGYHCYWLSGDKEGYSGVGLLSKEKPLKVEYGIGIDEHDQEGRVITAEYEQFYLVSTYVPNAGRGLVRLDYRMKWDKDFRAYLKKLDTEKPVILCGDLNVAHEEIDLANPKTNKKNAGFTKEEREGFSSLLKEGFVDTFRHLYPDMKGAYTFWTYMMNARAKNVGWRLDYFVMSEKLTEKLCDNVIRKDVYGSDHCPVTLFLAL